MPAKGSTDGPCDSGSPCQTRFPNPFLLKKNILTYKDVSGYSKDRVILKCITVFGMEDLILSISLLLQV